MSDKPEMTFKEALEMLDEEFEAGMRNLKKAEEKMMLFGHHVKELLEQIAKHNHVD